MSKTVERTMNIYSKFCLITIYIYNQKTEITKQVDLSFQRDDPCLRSLYICHTHRALPFLQLDKQCKGLIALMP